MCDVLLFSNYYIQLVRFDKKKKKLANVATVALKAGAIVRGEIIDSEYVGSVLSEIYKKEKSFEKVILVIPESNITSKSMSLPANVEKEVDEAVNFEAEQYLPYPIKSMVLDYKQVPNGKEKHVLFFAAKKDIIDSYINIVGNLGLDIIAIETPALSLSRLVEKEKEVFLLVYADKYEAVLTIVKNSEVVATSVLNRSGGFSDVLKTTVYKMLSFYNKFKVKQIRVGGMGVNKTLVSKLSLFKIPVAGFSPLHNIDPKVFNSYLLPISAAVSEIELPENKKTINLLPSWYVEKYKKIKANRFWSKLLFFYLIFIIPLFTILVSGYSWLSYKKRDMINVQKAIPQTEKDILDQVNNTNKYAKLALSLSDTDYFPIKTFDSMTQVAEEGIDVLKVEFSAQDFSMIISGIASDRETLLSYKKKLEELEDMVVSVALPVSSFNSDKDIPFQFYLKINSKISELEKE